MNTPLDWPGFGQLTPVAVLTLCAAALVAGLVDAIVGGGGLIQLPALLLFLPGGQAVYSLATNKIPSVTGTAVAAATYSRRVRIDWAHTLPMAAAAFGGSAGGAVIAAALPSRALTAIVLVALIGVGLYTWRRPGLGLHHAPRLARRNQLLVMLAGGLVIGFWDGLAGPGTGAFLVFMLVGIVGFAFLAASASAKIVNVATNLGSLTVFVPAGVVLFGLGAVMAVCNVVGAVIGTRLAVRRGSAFVRLVFLWLVGALVVSLAVKLVITPG